MKIFFTLSVALFLAGCGSLHEGVGEVQQKVNRGLSGGGQIISVDVGPQH